MAPVILALKNAENIDCKVLATAQHRNMLDQVLAIFNIAPDFDLDIMRPNQDLTTLTARLLLDLDDILNSEKPDAVLAQGDTTTVMSIAMACFYHHIPFGHVEAGLRTWNLANPFPEEMNRVIAGKLTKWHFAPTESARQNLLKEGVALDKIIVTGNTVIDALHYAAARETAIPVPLDPAKRLILVTAHRRENFGEPIRQICRAVLHLVNANPTIQILFPVHPNPNVKQTVHELLDNHPQIILCEPLEYLPFVAAMKQSYIILSDSGGVQEEAPALGKPVLVLRHETERPEAVEAGVVKLVGPVYGAIIEETQHLLDETSAYKKMSKNISPYGDGHSAERIVKTLSDWADSID